MHLHRQQPLLICKSDATATAQCGLRLWQVSGCHCFSVVIQGSDADAPQPHKFLHKISNRAANTASPPYADEARRSTPALYTKYVHKFQLGEVDSADFRGQLRLAFHSPAVLGRPGNPAPPWSRVRWRIRGPAWFVQWKRIWRAFWRPH